MLIPAIKTEMAASRMARCVIDLSGGTAMVLEHGINGNMITLYDDHGHNIPLLWTHLIPATLVFRHAGEVAVEFAVDAMASHDHGDHSDHSGH